MVELAGCAIAEVLGPLRRGLIAAALLVIGLGAGASVARAAAGAAVVPRNDRAVIFSPLIGHAGTPTSVEGSLHTIARRLDAEHYDVRTDVLDAATLAHFVQLGRASVVVILTHGDQGGGLLAQVEPTARARDRAYDSYVGTGCAPCFSRKWIAKGDVELSGHRGRLYGVGITAAGIAHFFAHSHLGLVVALACDSTAAAPAFNALSFLGYRTCVAGQHALSDAINVFSRMTGAAGLTARSSTDAVADLAAHDGLELSGPGGGAARPVVLSPAVATLSPDTSTPLQPGLTVAGDVQFDAQMDTHRTTGVVTASGCGAKVSHLRWTTHGTNLRFALRGTANSGTVRLIVHAAKALGAPGRGPNDRLDGNEDPQGDSGVAPNGDDYSVEIPCGGPGITLQLSGAVSFHYSSGSAAVGNLSRQYGDCEPTSLGQQFQYIDDIPGVGHFALSVSPIGTYPFPQGNTYTFPYTDGHRAELLLQVGDHNWNAGYTDTGSGAGEGTFTMQTATKPGAISLTLNGGQNFTAAPVHISGSWHC